MNNRLTHSLSAIIFSVSSLLVAFGIAWALLYQLSFSYGRWHDIGRLDHAIELYGPQNHYRFGFQHTTKAQREELFRQMSEAVHNHGEGLAAITFKVPGYPKQYLLTPDEVGHLQDVANLVDKVIWLVAFGALAWLLAMIFYFKLGLMPPSVLSQLLAIAALMLLFVIVLLVIGPTKAFSKMHEWVFPPGHPWFFYYQHSLMSTMMWAPRLFGWVAAEWAVFSVIFFGMLQYGAYLILRWLTRFHDCSKRSSSGVFSAR